MRQPQDSTEREGKRTHVNVERVALEEEAQVGVADEHRVRHDLVERRLEAEPAVLDELAAKATCRHGPELVDEHGEGEQVRADAPMACFSGMPGTMTPGLFWVRASYSQRKWLKRRRTAKSGLR